MKELSQEVRTVLAITLSMVVIVVWGYFFRPKPPSQPGEQPGAQKTAATPPAGGAAQPAGPAAVSRTGAAAGPKAVSAAVAPAPLAASSEQALIVESSVYHVELSNRGASVRSWQLTKEKDDVGKTLDLVHAPVSQQSGRWPLMLALEDAQQESAANGALYNVTFGSREYLIQRNWVNASGGYCALSY